MHNSQHIISQISKNNWTKIIKELEFGPIQITSLPKIEQNYKRLKNALPSVKLYYAVKANPRPEILELLNNLGCYFDVASFGEVESLMKLKINQNNLIYSNTSKSNLDVKLSHYRGINRFVSHSKDDLDRLSKHAPNSEILIRMSADCGNNVVFPHKGRFGVKEEDVNELFDYAFHLGLKPLGLHAHHGSENKDPNVWNVTIKKMVNIIKKNRQKYPDMRIIDISGGFSSPNSINSPTIEDFGKIITNSINYHTNKDDKFEFIAEPGRIIVANSSITLAEILEIKEHNIKKNMLNVTTTAGAKNAGLQEPGVTVSFFRKNLNGTFNFEYHPNKNTKQAAFYDATCDDFSAMIENPEIPLNIKNGDIVIYYGTGAYCNTLLQAEFNTQITPLELIIKLNKKNSLELTQQIGQSSRNLKARKSLYDLSKIFKE